MEAQAEACYQMGLTVEPTHHGILFSYGTMLHYREASGERSDLALRPSEHQASWCFMQMLRDDMSPLAGPLTHAGAVDLVASPKSGVELKICLLYGEALLKEGSRTLAEEWHTALSEHMDQRGLKAGSTPEDRSEEVVEMGQCYSAHGHLVLRGEAQHAEAALLFQKALRCSPSLDKALEGYVLAVEQVVRLSEPSAGSMVEAMLGVCEEVVLQLDEDKVPRERKEHLITGCAMWGALITRLKKSIWETMGETGVPMASGCSVTAQRCYRTVLQHDHANVPALMGLAELVPDRAVAEASLRQAVKVSGYGDCTALLALAKLLGQGGSHSEAEQLHLESMEAQLGCNSLHAYARFLHQIHHEDEAAQASVASDHEPGKGQAEAGKSQAEWSSLHLK